MSEDRKNHPQRGVSRAHHASRSMHPHTSQASRVEPGSPWTSGFVGKYVGSDNGKGYFSAEATGGGESDSLLIPWEGGEHMKGKTLAMLPSEGASSVLEGAHAWDLDSTSDSSIHSAYSHLPGYPGAKSNK